MATLEQSNTGNSEVVSAAPHFGLHRILDSAPTSVNLIDLVGDSLACLNLPSDGLGRCGFLASLDCFLTQWQSVCRNFFLATLRASRVLGCGALLKRAFLLASVTGSISFQGTSYQSLFLCLRFHRPRM